jgi:hypothetical protein
MERPTVGILHANESILTHLSVYRLDDGVYYTWKEMDKTSVASVNYGSVKLKKTADGLPMESYTAQIAEEIKSGKYGIVFIDTAYLDEISSLGLLTKTDDVFKETSLKDEAITDYGVYFDTLEIKNISGFFYMNGTETTERSLSVALVAPEYFSSEKEYEKYKAYYKYLCEFVVPENEV